MSLSLPTKYSRIPIPNPPGSLGTTLAGYADGILMNLTAVATSINQTVQALAALDRADASIIQSVEAVKRSVATLGTTVADLSQDLDAAIAAAQDCVLLTADGGGSVWALEDLPGYPNFRAVIIDPNAAANTLELPAFSASDRACFTVKVTASSGSVILDAGSSDIVVFAAAVASTYTLPEIIVGTGFTTETYAITLIWDGSVWQVIDSAIRVS